MIIGVGTDIVAIARIEKVFARHPAAFIHRILTARERSTFHQRWGQSHARAMAYLATRFAAKEAGIKALSKVQTVQSWQHMEILSKANGAPEFNWHGPAPQQQPYSFFLSLSDEQHYAQAMLVVTQFLPSQ